MVGNRDRGSLWKLNQSSLVVANMTRNAFDAAYTYVYRVSHLLVSLFFFYSSLRGRNKTTISYVLYGISCRRIVFFFRFFKVIDVFLSSNYIFFFLSFPSRSSWRCDFLNNLELRNLKYNWNKNVFFLIFFLFLEQRTFKWLLFKSCRLSAKSAFSEIYIFLKYIYFWNIICNCDSLGCF